MSSNFIDGIKHSMHIAINFSSPSLCSTFEASLLKDLIDQLFRICYKIMVAKSLNSLALVKMPWRNGTK